MSPTLRSRRDTSTATLIESRTNNKEERISNEARGALPPENHSTGPIPHSFDDRPGESPDPHLMSPIDLNGVSFSRNHSMDDDSQDFDDEDLDFHAGIRIANLEKINYPGLIRDMYERFKKKAETWERNARMYSRWSFFLNFLILFMQMIQMVIAQFIDIFDVTARFAQGDGAFSKFRIPRIGLVRGKQHVTAGNDQSVTNTYYWAQALQCVLAAFSGLTVGLQMKLKLLQKAEKYRRGAKVYGKLRRTSAYYLILLENGGKVEDITRLWKEAMKQETRNVPTVKTFMVT